MFGREFFWLEVGLFLIWVFWALYSFAPTSWRRWTQLCFGPALLLVLVLGMLRVGEV